MLAAPLGGGSWLLCRSPLWILRCRRWGPTAGPDTMIQNVRLHCRSGHHDTGEAPLPVQTPWYRMWGSTAGPDTMIQNVRLHSRSGHHDTERETTQPVRTHTECTVSLMIIRKKTGRTKYRGLKGKFCNKVSLFYLANIASLFAPVSPSA